MERSQAKESDTLSRPLIWLAWLLLALAVICHLLLPFLAYHWSPTPFPGFAVQPALVIGSVRGSDWPAPNMEAALLRQAVVQVDGQEVTTQSELISLLEGHAPGEAVQFKLEALETQRTSLVDIALSQFSRIDLFALFWLPYAAGILLLAVGGWTLWQRRSDPTAHLFALFCGLAATSLSLVFDSWTTQTLAWLWLLALPIASSLLLALASVFPGVLVQRQTWRGLPWYALIPGLALAAWNLINLIGRLPPASFLAGLRATYVFGFLALAFLFGAMLYRRARAESQVVRSQSRLVLLGGLVGVAPLGYRFLQSAVAASPGPYAILYIIPLIMLPMSIAGAILREDELDVDSIIQRGLGYLLVFILLAVAVALVALFNSQVLSRPQLSSEPLFIAVLVAILFIALEPLRKRLQDSTSRILGRPSHDHRLHLQQFGQSLTMSLDLESAISAIHAFVSEILEPKSLVIFVHHRRASAFLSAPAEHRLSRPLLEDSHLIQFLQGHRAILLVRDLVDLAEESSELIGPLSDLGAQVVAPIHGTSGLVGFLALGPHTAGRDYSAQELQLLENLTDRASVTLERAQALSEMATRAHEMNVLNQASQALTSTLELDPLLQIIMQRAEEVLEAEAGSLLLTDEEAEELVFKVATGPVASEIEGKRIPIEAGLAGATVASRQPIISNEAQSDKRWYQAVDEQTEFQTRSILAVPLISKTKVVGVLELINKQNQLPFNQDDLELALAFANQAALALENAQLYTQTDLMLAERVHELTMLQELDRVLNSTLEIDRVINMTLDWAMRTGNATTGGIGLVDWADNSVRMLATRYQGEPPPETESGETWPLGKGIVGRAIQEARPILLTHSDQDPTSESIGPSTQCQLAVPIVREDQVIGIIALESDTPNGFGGEQLMVVSRLADHAAVAIDNARLYESVRQANLAKSEFISLVSHELKTPMTSIQGYSDLLLSQASGELAAMQINFLQTIKDNVTRMRRLVQDLADSSRIDTGQLSIDRLPIPFSAVVGEALRTMRPACEEKGLELVLETPDILPQVDGDHLRLVQILTNLVSNAYKYTPSPGRITVSFSQELVELPGEGTKECIVCSVQDTGIGISPEEQQRLFVKFFRSKQSLVQDTKGTGLGLFITKSLIEMHGGKIWLTSVPGQGSTFSFAIPCLPAA